MLLVKYEKFNVVSKDSFIEELLYKYEKNINNFQTFEKKGKTLLLTMYELLSDENQTSSEILPYLNEEYSQMYQMKDKLGTLIQNQDFVYKTLSDALNKKLENGTFNMMKEVYTLQKFIGALHQQLIEDLKNKIYVIEEVIPRLLVEQDGCDEDVLLALDLWQHHNIIELN